MVQGWMPRQELKRLDAFAEQQGLAFLAEPPQADEEPPTLMDNPPNLSGGEDLVSFYQTPGYRNWDPSIVVFFSFALFFAMILADAGYTVILALILAYFWKQMGQSAAGRHFRILGVVVLAASLVYGILVGSYFGIEPAEGSWLASFKLLSVNDVNTMMKLSISIGCLHVGLANAIVAYRAGNLTGSAQPLGWIVAICGGLTLYLSSGEDIFWHNLGLGLLVGGFFLVFLGGFLSSQQKLPWRLLGGFSSLTGISGLFGDILSYLRLFALGLASASLALTFNTMAKQVVESAGGTAEVEYLFAFVILLLGHSINLALAIVSGFVHGLRLNFIEFFKWGLSDEGYPFQAFAKKEIET
jgi:V/A-type H+-transporting ATPase subunit I